MIGALSARSISDFGARDLASEWGGTGLAVSGARVARPVGAVKLRPVRERTSF